MSQSTELSNCFTKSVTLLFVVHGSLFVPILIRGLEKLD